MTDQWSFARFAPATGPEAARVARGEAVGGVPAKAGTVTPAEASAALQSPPSATIGTIPAATVVTGPAVRDPAPNGPRFVGGPDRVGSVALLSPVEFNGRLWDEIPLRRPTSREVGRYYEQLRAKPGEWTYFPCFAEPDGTPVPAEVLDFLDDDDSQRVHGAAEDFLPLRLLQLLGEQRPGSAPTAGDSTAPMSST